MRLGALMHTTLALPLRVHTTWHAYKTTDSAVIKSGLVDLYYPVYIIHVLCSSSTCII